MSRFSFNKRGLYVNQFSDTHTGISLHTQSRSSGPKTKVTVTAERHAPNTEHLGFYALSLVVNKPIFGGDVVGGVDYSSDNLTAFLDRDTIERIHRATGELLEKSKDMVTGEKPCCVVLESPEEEE